MKMAATIRLVTSAATKGRVFKQAFRKIKHGKNGEGPVTSQKFTRRSAILLRLPQPFRD